MILKINLKNKNLIMNEIFEIDTDIYNSDFIIQSMDDFSEYANIEYNNWELKIFWENKWDILEIYNEFMNYVIWIINNN